MRFCPLVRRIGWEIDVSNFFERKAGLHGQSPFQWKAKSCFPVMNIQRKKLERSLGLKLTTWSAYIFRL